ncbi:MAG: septum formation protein Maf [Gemmatimonadota bacterium]|nr:MAG: septum formation protein Maf [Gemmatimonadota bacterium]
MDAPRLILASRSPRRAELLSRLGLQYTVRVLDVDESVLSGEAPAEAAQRLARLKAAAALDDDALAIGCDTLVVHRGDVLGKPTHRGEAVQMVCRLQGEEHLVYTGVALAAPGRVETAVEATRVWFRSLDPRECEEYVATGEPMDKAGAYGIQGFGAAIVERIEGDYFNVMGLPIQRLLELFRRFGWRYAFGRLVRLT